MELNIFQNILISLFVNGLSYLIGFSSGKVSNCMFENEEYTKSLIKEINFESVIEEMLDEGELGEIKIEDICEFLKSPGTESIVRQIYASKIYTFATCDAEEKASIEDIREEFILLFLQNFEGNRKNISNLGNKIFSILIAGCEIALEKAVSNGELSAHEAESKYRFKLLSDQLDVVIKNIELLSGKHKPDIREIKKFIEKYRRVVKKRYETIRSASYSNIRPPIDEIYVCPYLIKKKDVRMECESEKSLDVNPIFSDTQELISIDNFLPALYRIVLLGDPGAGKSTFAQKISHDIVTKYSDKVSPRIYDIPIIVTLREYQVENLQNKISILDFIIKDIHSSYQIKVTSSTLEYLFLNGYALIIFDGLDELLETRLREKIVDEIESFCAIYPSVSILVTSRKVGYEQAALRVDMFKKFELAPFDGKQIEEYVNKWFSLDPSLTCREKEQKVKSFLRESEIVPDIRSNSLMLSLMCSIYREENYIPTNRPEVYKKCSEMLFEKWDKSRGIAPSILVAQPKIKSLISYLAYVIFTNDSLQKGINENKLVDKAKDYLLETLYENEDEAEDAAKDFICFCKGRAWVLTDTGTTRYGENIYQFTHRTFLEYFAAEWIARKYEQSISEILLPRICKGEWDNVSQLAFQIRYEKSEGGDKLFVDLLKKLNEVEVYEKFNLLFFASRCLGFIVPSPRVTREITTECFDFAIHFDYKLLSEYIRKAEEEPRVPFELIYMLENPMHENRNTIADTIENLIVNNISKGSKDEALLSCEICLNLGKAMPWHIRYEIFRTSADFWKSLKITIIERCSYRISELIKEERNFGVEFYHLKRISLIDIVSFHGFQSLFSFGVFTIIPSTLFRSVYSSLFNEWFYNERINIKDFGDFGRLTLSQSRRRLKAKDTSLDLDTYILTNHSKDQELKIKPYHIITEINKNTCQVISYSEICDSIFGVFCLLAYLFEELIHRLEKERISNMYEFVENNHIFSFLKIIFMARLGTFDLDKQNVELRKMKFTDEQRTFIEKWVRKEIHLLNYRSKI